MCAEGAVPGAVPLPPALPPLPPPGEFLRSVIALGRRALRPTLPALAFLYFYRLGMGLFLELSPGAHNGAGEGDALRHALTGLMVAWAFAPVIVVLFAPFLAVEDALLRGEPVRFRDGVRRVLHVAFPFLLSQIAQLLIVVGPAAAVCGAAIALTLPYAPLPAPMGLAVAAGALLPAFAWMLLAAFFFSFAMPALVLDGRGPIQSIRVSVGLIRRRFGGVFGRVFVFGALYVLVAVVAGAPSGFIRAAVAASGNENPILRVPGVIWESAVDALLFPFTAAATVVLYRALVPRAAAGAAGAGGAETAPAPGDAQPPSSPFQFE